MSLPPSCQGLARNSNAYEGIIFVPMWTDSAVGLCFVSLQDYSFPWNGFELLTFLSEVGEC